MLSIFVFAIVKFLKGVIALISERWHSLGESGERKLLIKFYQKLV